MTHLAGLNHGHPQPGSQGEGDVFYCRSCRSELFLSWGRFTKAMMEFTCPHCMYTDMFARSFVDPSADSENYTRPNGAMYVFGARRPGFLAMSDVFYCPGCNRRGKVSWGAYGGPVVVYACNGCRRDFRLVLSESGRSSRGFKRLDITPPEIVTAECGPEQASDVRC